MEKLLLSLSNFSRDIKKIYFVILFLLSSSLGLAQSITTNKTVTVNPTNCGIVNVKVDITGANPVTRNSDVILAIDISGSMAFTIPGSLKTSMDYAKDAAIAFLTQAKANPQNRIAIVAYSTTASLKIGLTYLNAAGVTAITNQINALQATNSTNIYAGIVKSKEELDANGRFDCSTARAIILLTDGVTNATETNGSTTCNTSKTSQCVTDAIAAGTSAKTTTKLNVVYNNQLFSVGLLGGLKGNVNTNNSEQNIAKFTLDGIQGSASYVTQTGANLTSIYNQIATQISWVAQSLITKETIIPGFTIGSITTTKGTASLSGQVITWNTDFLNSETITLNYQLTPTGTACGNQTVSTSTLNYQNSSCAPDSKVISSPSYFVPCAPVITGTLTACGSTTLTTTTNATSPTYVWYKDNNVIAGQTASTLIATTSGVYTVKVKNGSTNCELTSLGSTVTISPAAALTAPANTTISGCGTGAITGLSYNTASTNISLAQLTAAGGTLPNNALIGAYTISYSDTVLGTCPIVVTRTFKVSAGCGNITSVQTITIQDTTAPTWTTLATALNTTLQCSDTAGLTAAQAQAPVATDNCGGTITYTKTSGAFVKSATCANAGTYTNTWLANDVCANTSSVFTQTITIQDTTAPTWTTLATALNTTLQCSDTAGLTAAQAQAPVATDNCGGIVTYTKTSGAFVKSATCANAGTYTNTWLANDVCANTSSVFTQTITIQDTTAPTWTTLATALNTTLQCSDAAGLTAAQGQAPVATDNCGGIVTYTKTSGTFVKSATCANAGTYTNTWLANDVCANTSSVFTQTITIQDTTAPTWTTLATALNTTLQCSDAAGLTAAQAQAPVATDNCGGTVTYTKTSGAFVKSATCANAGTYTNTWLANDVCANTSSVFTQTITIQDTTAPTWTTLATALNTTLQCSDTAGLIAAQAQAPIATDNCGGTVTYTKTSGAFVKSATCANAGTYTNTWLANDVCANTSSVFTQTITIQDTTAPTWTTLATALNTTLQCSDAAGLTAAQAQAPVATDNCGGTVTYTKTSGAFVKSATCANAGTYTNTWLANDVCANTSTVYTQTITIQDTTAPTWTTLATALNTTLQCSDTAGLTAAQAQAPVATDNCGGTVTYTKTSGAFVKSATCANAGTYTNTWLANDVCANTSSVFTQTITIQDTTAPTWTTLATALNTTLQCSDTAGLTAAQAQAPVATDNCGGTVTYTKTSGTFVKSATCANAGTYTNTWIANDVCANTSSVFTQTITIQDTTAPTWTTLATALNTTLQCSDAAGLTAAQGQAPVATDNCGGIVTYTKTSGAFVKSATCANAGTYTNTWIANDVCANTSSVFTQTITIQDTTAPTWTTLATALNTTLQCSDAAGLTAAQGQAPVATDNCGGIVTYTKTSGAFVKSATCANAGTYTNTWLANDVCANTSSVFTQTITIQDTTAPTWTTAATALNTTLQCSDAAGLTAAQAQAPIATDNCGGIVTYTKTSGAFVKSATCANAGTYTNTWLANDVCANTSSVFTQTITIQDTTAPTWTTAATALNTTLQCSDTAGLTAAQAQAPVATDNCGGIVTYTKTSGAFVKSATCANAGTYTNTWLANDVCANTSSVFTQTITIQDTTAPTWTTLATALNTTLQCSDAAGLTAAQGQAPVATDNCGGIVTYTKTSGAFVKSATCANAGTYTNTWLANDVCANTSSVFTQTITIQDTTAPTWTTAATALNTTLQCSDTAGLTAAQAQAPVATDNCGGTVTYTKTSGQFQRGSCGSTGTYTNTWIANDFCNNTSDVFTQVITVQDTAIPTWITQTGSLNITLECSNATGLATAQNQAPSATANCSIVTYTKNSGKFMPSITCGNAGTYTNTWIAKDDCGNITDVFTQVITIQDTTAPTWTTEVASLNKTIECSDAAALTAAQALIPTASDSCDNDVSNIVKVSGEFVTAGGCGNAGTYTNTWTVKDDCGNTSDTFTQVITIQDTTAPTWTTEVASLNKTIECSDAAALTTAQALIPTASDSCDNDVTNIVKVSGEFVTAGGCSNAGTYTNTWTVKDDCGNTSDTFTQVITIQDTTAPTWATEVASLNKTVECSDATALAAAQALIPTASDSCDNDVTNIVKVSGEFVTAGGCSNAGTYTNTWTVKDDCGNTSDTFTQVITIQDTTAPTFIGNLPSDITVSCDAVPEPANVEASDNCSGNLPIVFTETKSNIVNECASNYTLTRKWTTSDCSGNTISHTQIVTVRDTTAPTGTAPTDIANLQSIADIPAGSPADIKDAADNCSSTVNITVSDSHNGGSGCDGNAYILTRTYTLTDCAGNKTELKQTFTVENKVSVTGVASNVTCFGGKDGLILVTNSPGSTVIIRNENNEVVSNSNLPAGTYILTATSAVNAGNETCSATTTVVISQPTYTVKISGQVINKDSNTPIANVPVTLIPQGTTTGPVLLRITGADGLYNFSGMPAGSYLVQVQDANLNSAHQLYPLDSSLFFTTLEDCKIQQHNFEYEKSNLPVLGDYVWYDTNGNGIQDEWYDANNDGIVTKNIPDSNGAIDYSQWEWIDLNGDGSYAGPSNVGELNAGGFGNALSANVIVDGPNGYHQEVVIGISGYWRDRPATANPNGDYTIKLVKDANLDAVATALGATGLVKIIPTSTGKKATNSTNKSQSHTVCSTTGGASGYIVTITPEDLIHLDADFGVNCKTFADIVANDDKGGPIARATTTTPNVLNVLLNDTLGGVVVTASDVIITTVTPNEFLQLNPDGSINVLPNAPTSTLTMVYQICEADQTTNCDTATVTITIVDPAPPTPVLAVNDVYNNIGCNTFGLVGNVLINDFKGVAKATLELINFTLLNETNNGTKTNPNITFDTLGNVNVSSLTPAGTYVYSYQICDKLSSENCSTATITITVVPNGITNIVSKACNDDSTLIDLLKLLPENTPTSGIWVDPSNSNTIQGNTFNALGLALGNYTFEYRIADQNCPRSIVLSMEVNDDCKVLACGNVVVHNAFSPNGDGMNDLFKIDSIDETTCYPENHVEIYNRWGILVFETDNYNNTTNAFDGTSRGRTTIKQSDGLPAGTYFYIVNYKSLDGNNVLQNNKKDGYLYLSR